MLIKFILLTFTINKLTTWLISQTNLLQSHNIAISLETEINNLYLQIDKYLTFHQSLIF